MKKIKLILIVFLIIWMANLAYAIPNPQPIITVVFDEAVNVSTIQRSLTDILGNPFELVDVYNSPDNVTFKFQPVELLDDGTYVFTISADDIYGNPGEIQTQQFTVEIAALNISIIRPSFGVSDESPFEVVIKTDRYGDCRYSLINTSYPQMVGLFTTNDNLIHKINSYTKTGDFYVKCNDSYGDIYSKRFVLVYDTADPVIEYLHVDDVFEFFRPGIIKTKMALRANEPVVCKYVTNDAYKNYDEMGFFSGLDENNIDSYKGYHEHNLTNNELENYQTNYVYVICKDKAEGLSLRKVDDFIVSTNQTPVIIINNPKYDSYTSNTTVGFDVTTSKNAVCKYGSRDEFAKEEDLEDYSKYPHLLIGIDTSHYATETLLRGTYRYHVKCRFAVEGDQPQVSTLFTIDTSAPIISYVNDTNPDLHDNPEYTYHTNKLYGKWFAYDSETSIGEYAYYIYLDNTYSEDVLIASGTTPETEEWVTGLNLNDSKKYYFKVSAKNRVGLWSSNLTSNGITVDISLKPATCSDGIKNDDETDVDCGGGCSPCADGKECSLNDDCISGNCADGTCAGSSCNDGIKNDDETDVDCGGSCLTKCPNSKICRNDEDCLSEYCEKGFVNEIGVCSELDMCSDGIKNNDETDVDCGGSCSSCADGKGCGEDSDCMSNNCENDTCQVPICYDNILNGDETDVDCGGSCPACPVGSRCGIDSDCSSGICKSSICIESDDKDEDGLSNEWEEMYGLDPDSYDSDNNGISDADEDMDNDGLTNAEEYYYGTDPTNPDTDGDGYSDKEEIDAGTDPNDFDSKPKSKIWFYLILFVALIIAGVGSYYGYRRYNEYLVGKGIAKARLPLPKGEGVGAKQLGIPPIRKQVMKDRPEVKKIVEERKKEKEVKRKGLFEKFGKEKEGAKEDKRITKLKERPETQKTFKEKQLKRKGLFEKFGPGKGIPREVKVKEDVAKLKKRPVSQAGAFFKRKGREEIKRFPEKSYKAEKKTEKIKPEKKAEEKEDVFSKLSKVLPSKKKKQR